ncbi:hypothetical protein D3C83_47130 [compost metagenome]
MVRSYARIGEYRQAMEAIPSLASTNDLLVFYRNILVQENLKRKNNSGEWERFYRNRGGYGFTTFQNDLVGE